MTAYEAMTVVVEEMSRSGELNLAGMEKEHGPVVDAGNDTNGGWFIFADGYLVSENDCKKS